MSQQLTCKSTIDRAFELAASDDVTSLEQLNRALNREGYSTSMLSGPLLLKQLRQQIAADRAPTKCGTV